MADVTRVQEGFGGNRWMAQAGIGRSRRSIGSLPSPWEQARRAGVVARVGNVATEVAEKFAMQDYLAIHDPVARRRVANGTPIEEATGDYKLLVATHGGEMLVSKMARDADETISIDELESELDIAAELPAIELVGANAAAPES